MSEVIHVVAGILRDAEGRILLTQRPPGKHLAGLWEFPGGKCEVDESPQSALRRELHEELGIEIGALESLLSVPWQYPQKHIVLDVFRVLDYAGVAHGREGQAIRWTGLTELDAVAMPPADRPVVAALRLPPHYVITPECHDDKQFLSALQRLLDSGEKCIQLRCKRLEPARLRDLAQAAKPMALEAGAQLLLNQHSDLARELDLGVHLPAAELMRSQKRPLDAGHWVAASCHDEHELAQAAHIGVDFAVVGPVQRTATHPGTPLGWPRFADLCRQAPFPVYALGGLTRSDLSAAKLAGAQGVAGISAFWPRSG